MTQEINLTPTSSQFEIPRLNQTPIQACSWGSANDCKAVALLVHGLGAHAGWFEAFARQLKVRRIFALAFDQIGFGKRRHEPFEAYTQWIDDLVGVFDYIHKTLPNKPVYLVGNSMGALLSLVAVEHINPDGLVLSSPGFDGSPQTFTWQYRAITIFKAMLCPEMLQDLPYDASLCTRDASTRAWITNDQAGCFRVPGKMLFQLRKLSNETKNQPSQVKMPVLVLTAGQDCIANNQVTAAFFEALSAPSKKHRNFVDAFHDLMFDPLIDEVADEVEHFMSQQTVERLITGSQQ